ncbi:unnamed protein product [Closterium sp. NIES-64]|nr:unnamed protein product [Closterium sp. NIES-64]
MSQEQPRREEMEGQAKVRFSTFFYLPFQHAPIGNPYTIPLSPPPSAIPSLFLLSSPFLLLQQEQFSTEPTQAAAIGAPGYAAGGTAVSAPGYAGGGYVATATGPGFTCTAQEFPTAGGGATGVLLGSAEPTGGEKSPATGATAEAGMVRDAGSDVTAGGQVTSAGDIAKAKEAGAAAAGGKTGGAETGGEGFMGRESEAKAMEGEGGIGSA